MQLCSSLHHYIQSRAVVVERMFGGRPYDLQGKLGRRWIAGTNIGCYFSFPGTKQSTHVAAIPQSAMVVYTSHCPQSRACHACGGANSSFCIVWIEYWAAFDLRRQHCPRHRLMLREFQMTLISLSFRMRSWTRNSVVDIPRSACFILDLLNDTNIGPIYRARQ